MPETGGMNGYGLTAVIIQSVASLAWPGALVIAVWLFRGELRKMLPLLRVKHKDWEASFRLDKAEQEVAAMPAPPENPPEERATPEEIGRFEELVRLSPRAAIVEVRRELEGALLNTVAELPDPPSKPPSMLNATRILRSKGVIDPHTSAILDDLRSLGNAAVHSSGVDRFTEADAMRYRKLALQVMRTLRVAGRP